MEKLKKTRYIDNPEFLYLLLLFFLVGTVIFIQVNNNKFDCKKPKTYVGDRCCIEDNHNLGFCDDEGKIFQDKIKKTIQEKILTQNSLMKYPSPPFSFIPPKDYYYIENIKAGGQDIPYYFFKLTGNNDLCTIRITLIKKSDVQTRTNLTDLTLFYTEIFNSSFKKINMKKIINENNVTGISYEYEDDKDRKLKSVYFEDLLKENLNILNFGCQKENSNYDALIADFDSIVSSFKFMVRKVLP